MILQDEHGKPLVINEMTNSLKSNYIWCLDLKDADFRLHTIKVLEECECVSLVIKVNDRLVCLPTHWHILVCDPETTQLDAVQVGDLANANFYAMLCGTDIVTPIFAPITVIDYLPAEKHVYPTHTRSIMLCHDVGNGLWMNCSYADAYNRFLKNKTANDLVDY